MAYSHSTAAVWPPRTPPAQGAQRTNGSSEYAAYDTKRGPNALFSPQAEAVKSVGDVIAAIDFDNDMHVQATEFQHGLLEALLRLWCTPQSLPAVQLEVQSSLADLIPSEMVRLHLLDSFTQHDALGHKNDAADDTAANGGFRLISVATPEDAAEWQEDDDTHLQEPPSRRFDAKTFGQELTFGKCPKLRPKRASITACAVADDTADFGDRSASGPPPGPQIHHEAGVEFVEEKLFLPSSSMASNWFSSVLASSAQSETQDLATGWDDAATDGTRDTLDTPARIGGDIEGKATVDDPPDGSQGDVPPFLFVQDPVVLALLFQQVGRAQPSTLGIQSVMWVPIYARESGSCIGFLEFWNRVPQGFGLAAAPPLTPSDLQPTTSRGGIGSVHAGRTGSTTPRRTPRHHRRVHMADSAFPTHVAAVDGAFEDDASARPQGTPFHEGDLAVLQLLSMPISIALHHAAYYTSTSDGVAAMRQAVGSLREQVAAAEASASHHQARDANLMQALVRSGVVQACVSKQLASDSHDWPALRLASGLPASRAFLLHALSSRAAATGWHLQLPRPICLSASSILHSLREVSSAVATWSRATAPLLLGGGAAPPSGNELATPAATGSSRLWFNTTVLKAIQDGEGSGALSAGSADGPFSGPAGGLWSPRGGACTTRSMPSQGIIAGVLRSLKPRFIHAPAGNDAEWSGAEDTALGIHPQGTAVVVPLSLLPPGQQPPTPDSRTATGGGKRSLRLFFPGDEAGQAAPGGGSPPPRGQPAGTAHCLGVLVIQVQGTSGDADASALEAGAVAIAHSIELYLGYLMASHSAVHASQQQALETEHWFRRCGSAMGAVLAHAAAMRTTGTPAPPSADTDAAPSAAGLCLPHWRQPTPHASPARPGDLLAAAAYALALTTHAMFQRLASAHPVHTALQLAGCSPAVQASLTPSAGPAPAAVAPAFGFAPPPLLTSIGSSSPSSALHVVSLHVGLVTQVPTAWMVGTGGGHSDAAPPTPRGGPRSHIAWDSAIPDSPATGSDGGTPASEHAALAPEGADYAAATGLCVMAGNAPAPSAFTAAALQQAARHAGYSTAGLFQVNLRTVNELSGGNDRSGSPGSASRRSKPGRSSQSGTCVLVWSRGALNAALYVPRTANARVPQVVADVLRLEEDFKFLGHVAAPDDAAVWCPAGAGSAPGVDPNWADVAVVSATCMPGSLARWHHVVLQSISLGMRSRVRMPAGLARGEADTSAYPAVAAITTLRVRVPVGLLGPTDGKGGMSTAGLSPIGSLDASVQASVSGDVGTEWEEPATPFGGAGGGTPQHALAAKVTAAAQLLLPLISPCLLSTAREAMAKSAEGASRTWGSRWSTVAAASVAAPALTGVLSDPNWLRQGDGAWWTEATAQLRSAMGAHGVVLYKYNGDLRLLEAVKSDMDEKSLVHLAASSSKPRQDDAAWEGSGGAADGLGFSPTGASRSNSRGRRRPPSPGLGMGGAVMPVADILSGYGVLPDSCLAGVGPLGSAWGDQRLLRQVVTVNASPAPVQAAGSNANGSSPVAAARAAAAAGASSTRPTAVQVELLAFPVSTSSLPSLRPGAERGGVGGASWCSDMAALSGSRISPSALVALLGEAEGQNGTQNAGTAAVTDAIVPAGGGSSTAAPGGSGDAAAGATVLVAVARVIGPVPRSASRSAPTSPSEALAHVTACVGAAQARHTLQHCLNHLNNMQSVVGAELAARSSRAHSSAERATAAMQDKLVALQAQYDALSAQVRGVAGQALSARSRVTELHAYVREAHLSGSRESDRTRLGHSTSNDNEGSAIAAKRSASLVWDSPKAPSGGDDDATRFGEAVTLGGGAAGGGTKERSTNISEVSAPSAGSMRPHVGPHPGAAAAMNASRTGSGDVAEIMGTLFHTDLAQATQYASDSLASSAVQLVSMPQAAVLGESAVSTHSGDAGGPLPPVVLHSTSDAFNTPLIVHTRRQLHSEHARLWLVDGNSGHMWTHIPFIGSGGHALATGSKATVTRVATKQCSSMALRAGTSNHPAGDDGDTSIWEMRFPLGHGLVGHVARTGQALVVKDAASHGEYDVDVDALDGGDSGNALLVPVLLPNGFVGAEDSGASRGGPKRVVGVLQIRNKTSLSYVLESSSGIHTRQATAAAPGAPADSQANSILTPFAAADVYTAAVSSRVMGAALAAHALSLQAHERFVNTGAKLARLHSQAAAEAFSHSQAGHIVHKGGGSRTRSAFLDGAAEPHGEAPAAHGTDYSSTIRSQARVQLLLECAAMLVTPTDVGSLSATAAEVIPTLLGVPAATTIVLAPSTPNGSLQAVVPPAGPGVVAGGHLQALVVPAGAKLHCVLASGNRCVESYKPSDAPMDASAASKRSANIDRLGTLGGSSTRAAAFSLEEQVMLRDLLLRSRIGGYASRGDTESPGGEPGAAGGSFDPGMAVLMLPLVADRTPRLDSAHGNKAKASSEASSKAQPAGADAAGMGFGRGGSAFGVRAETSSTSAAGRYIVGVLLVQIPSDELVGDEAMLTGASGPGGNDMGQFTVEHHTMMLLHVAHVLSGTLARHALHSSLSDTLGGAMQALITLQSASESMAVDLLWERSEALAAEARQRAVLRRIMAHSLHEATDSAQTASMRSSTALAVSASALTRNLHRSHAVVARWVRRGVERSQALASSCLDGNSILKGALAGQNPVGTLAAMATPEALWAAERGDMQLAVQPFAAHPALGTAGEPEVLLSGLPRPALAFMNELLSPATRNGAMGGGVGAAVLRMLFWIASGTHTDGANLPKANILAWGAGRTPTLLLPLAPPTPANSPPSKTNVLPRALKRAGDSLFDWCTSLLQEGSRMAATNSALEAQIVLRCAIAGNEYAVLVRPLPADMLQRRASLQRRSRVTPLELWELLGGERSDLPGAEQVQSLGEEDGASDDESARSVASADAATRQRVPGTLPLVACLFPCASSGTATPRSRRGAAASRRLPQPTGPGVELTVLPAVLWEALQMNSAGHEFVAPDERQGQERGTLQLQQLPVDDAGHLAERGQMTVSGSQAPATIRVQASFRSAMRSCSHIQALPLDDVLSSPHLAQTIEAAVIANRHARADAALVRLPSVPLLLTATSRADGWDEGRVAASFPGYGCDQKGRPVPLVDASAHGWPDMAEEEGLLDAQSVPRRRWVAHCHPLSVGDTHESGFTLGEVRFVWSVEVQPENEGHNAGRGSFAEEEGTAEWVSEGQLPTARLLPTQGVLGNTPHDLQLSIPALLHVSTIQMMCASVAHSAVLAWYRTVQDLRSDVAAVCMSSATNTTDALTRLSAVATRDSSAARAALATVQAINSANTLPMLTAAIVHCVPHLLQVIASSDHGDGDEEVPAGSAPNSISVRAALFVQRRVLGQCNSEKEAFTAGRTADEDDEEALDAATAGSDEDDDSTVWSDASDDDEGSEGGAPTLLGSAWNEWVRVTPGEVVPMLGRGDDSVQFNHVDSAGSVFADAGDGDSDGDSGAASGVRGILKKSSSRGQQGSKKRTLSFGGQGLGDAHGTGHASSARSVGALLAGGALAIDDIATEDGVLPAAGGAVGKSARTRESVLVTATQNADIALFPAERLVSPLGAVLTLPLPALMLHSLAVAEPAGAADPPIGGGMSSGRPSALGGFSRHSVDAVLRMEEGRFPREAAAPRPSTSQVVLPTGVSAVLLVACSSATIAAPHGSSNKATFSPASMSALGLVRDTLLSALSRIVQDAQCKFQLGYMGRIARRLQYRLNRALSTSHDFGVQLQRVMTSAFAPPASKQLLPMPDSGRSMSASEMGPSLHNVSYAGDAASDEGSALGMGGGSMMDSEAGYGDGSTAVVRMRARLDTLRSAMDKACAQVGSDGAEILVSSEYIVRCVMGNLLHALPAHVAVQHAIVETAGAAAAAGKPVSLAAALSMNAAAPLALASLPTLYAKVRSCVMSALSSGVPALGSASDSNLLARGSNHVLVPLHSGLAALEASLDMLLSGAEEGEGGPAVAWHRLVGAGGEDDGPIVGSPHAPHQCLDMGACGHQPRTHFMLAGIGDTLGGGSVSSPFTAASSVVSGVDGPSGISSSMAFGMGSVPALQSLQEERPIIADAPVGAAQDSWLTIPVQVPLAVVAARAKGVRRRQSREESQPVGAGTEGARRRVLRPEVPKGDAVDAVLRDIAEKAGVGAAAAGLGGGGSHADDEVLGVSRMNLQAEIATRAVAFVAAFPIRPGQGVLTDGSADAEDVVALADRAMAMAAASQQAAARKPGTSVLSGRGGGSDSSTVHTGGDGQAASRGNIEQSGVFSSDLPEGLRGHRGGSDMLGGAGNSGATGRAAALHSTPFGVVQLVTVKSRASRTARLAEAGSAKHKQRAARTAQADAQRQLLMHVHAASIGQLAAGLMWELTSFSVQRTLAGRMNRAVAFMRSLRLAYSSVRQHWAAERAQALVAHAAVRGATAASVAVSRSLDALQHETVEDDPEWRLRAEEAQERQHVTNGAEDVHSMSGAGDSHSHGTALTPTAGRTVRLTAPSDDVFSAVRSMLTGVMGAICKGLPAVTGAAGAVMWWSLSRDLALRCGLMRAGDANPGSAQRTAAGLPGSASADDQRVWIAAVPSVHSGGANIFAMADGEGLVRSAVVARAPFVAGDASGRDERYEAPEGRALRAAIQGALPHDLLDLSSIVQVAGNDHAALRVHGPGGAPVANRRAAQAHRSGTDSSIALGTVVCIPFSASARGGSSSPVRGVVELVLLRSGAGSSADCLSNAKPAMRAVKAAGSLLTALTHAVDAAEHALAVHATAASTVRSVAADRSRLHGSLGEHIQALNDTQQELNMVKADASAVSEQLATVRAATARERRISRMFEGAMGHLWAPLLRPLQAPQIVAALQLAHPGQQWDAQTQNHRTGALVRWVNGFCVDIGAAAVRVFLSADAVSRVVTKADPLTLSDPAQHEDGSSVRSSISAGPAGDRSDLVLAAEALLNGFAQGPEAGRIQLGLLRSQDGPGGDSFERRHTVVARDDVQVQGTEEQGRPDVVTVAAPLLVDADADSREDGVQVHVSQFACIGALYVEAGEQVRYDQAQVDLISLTARLLAGGIMQYAAWGNMMAASADLNKAQRSLQAAKQAVTAAQEDAESAATAAVQARAGEAAMQQAAARAEERFEEERDHGEQMQQSLQEADLSLTAVRAREAALRDQVDRYREMETEMEEARAVAAQKQGQLERMQTAYEELRAQMKQYAKLHKRRKDKSDA